MGTAVLKVPGDSNKGREDGNNSQNVWNADPD